MSGNTDVISEKIIVDNSDKNVENEEDKRKEYYFENIMLAVLDSDKLMDTLNDILSSNGFEIVDRIDPSNLIQDSHLKEIPASEKRQVRYFIEKVLEDHKNNYRKMNLCHLDSLTLSKMIPEIVHKWKKGITDPSKVNLCLPLPPLSPESANSKIQSRISDNQLNELFSESAKYIINRNSLNTSVTNYRHENESSMFPQSSTFNISSTNKTSSRAPSPNNTSSHALSSNNTSPRALSPNQFQIVSIGNNVKKSSYKIKTGESKFTLDDVPLLNTNIEKQCKAGHIPDSKRQQLYYYIKLCKSGPDCVNASALYNNYCDWCQMNGLDKYTRPMVIDSFRDKMPECEIKNSAGRSKGWALVMPC